jgi:hypothetical protein
LVGCSNSLVGIPIPRSGDESKSRSVIIFEILFCVPGDLRVHT